MPGATGGTYGYDIDGGNIAGQYYASGWHGFIYDGTTYTPLDVPGAYGTYARGIDGGNTVGYYNDSSYNSHGFSYDGTSYTTLDVPGATATYAYDIDGGTIVGYYTDHAGDYHGFLATIPEPSTALLLCLGLLALATGRWNR